MITYDNGGRLVQSLDELPNLKGAKNLYLDFETTSFDSKVAALLPHQGHRIAGICITTDEHFGAWYIPIRCTWKRWNLPLEPVLLWLKDIIGSCENWVNHNVKFDAHFARYDGIEFTCKLIDTIVLSKIINSDRMSFGLKELTLDWLEIDPGAAVDKIKAYLDGCKSKNFGDIPADIIGEYGCQDVITNRQLYEYLLRRKSDRVAGVWDTEIALTPVLFDMEVKGMRVDPSQLKIKEFLILNQMIKLEEELNDLLGFAIRPHTNADCYEAICIHYGLPVLSYTDDKDNKKEDGNPSFDKFALTSYLSHPIVRDSPEITEVITKIREYRKINTLLTFFVRPYQEHEVNGVMRPDYNQSVRTARLSCRRPNAQQLSSAAKALIIPFDGCDFVSYDLSQIEFRLIVHYIKDQNAIAAYNEDPDTDFHTWVAEMCGIPRSPAKNVNFAIAFGGGKRRVVTMLASNMELVGNISTKIDELVAAGKVHESQYAMLFKMLCDKRGNDVYDEYHSSMPTLKATVTRASKALKLRGLVYNAYGRERRLPEKAAFRAFNSIIQSTAADIMKERTVAIAPRYNKIIRDLGISISASVHDETLFNVPKSISGDMSILRSIRDSLEDTTVKFKVPIRTSCGRSDKNWQIASGDAGKINLNENI